MSRPTVESILKQIAGLPPGEQERLRALLLSGGDDSLAARPHGLPVRLANPIPEPDLLGAMEWIGLNYDQYRGQWVALDGSRLIYCSADHSEVVEAAKSDGAYLPLITFIELNPIRPFVRI
jgi:hypothetical protein